jgi:hypothetical protein
VARVAAIVPDLLFGSKVTEILSGAGHEVLIVPRAPEQPVDAIVVDLASGGVEPESFTAGRRLAIYAHTDVAMKERAEAAGFDLVVPRSRFMREGPALVAQLL